MKMRRQFHNFINFHKMKKELIFKIVFFALAIGIAVGNYYNFRPETGAWGILGMDVINSTLILGAVEVGDMLNNRSKYNWRLVLYGVGVSVIATLLCLI